MRPLASTSAQIKRGLNEPRGWGTKFRHHITRIITGDMYTSQNDPFCLLEHSLSDFICRYHHENNALRHLPSSVNTHHGETRGKTIVVTVCFRHSTNDDITAREAIRRSRWIRTSFFLSQVGYLSKLPRPYSKKWPGQCTTAPYGPIDNRSPSSH